MTMNATAAAYDGPKAANANGAVADSSVPPMKYDM